MTAGARVLRERRETRAAATIAAGRSRVLQSTPPEPGRPGLRSTRRARQAAGSLAGVVLVGCRRDLEPAHSPALGVQDHEVQAAKGGELAAPWDVAHCVRDQPADGFKAAVLTFANAVHFDRLELDG